MKKINKKLISALMSVSVTATSIPMGYADVSADSENEKKEAVTTSKEVSPAAEASGNPDASVSKADFAGSISRISEDDLYRSIIDPAVKSSEAQEETAEQIDFTYTIDEAGAVITGYTGNGGDVIIPDEIEGDPVVAIGSNAFNGKTAVTSVTIPDTVAAIGYRAFFGCSGIKAASKTKRSDLQAIS